LSDFYILKSLLNTAEVFFGLVGAVLIPNLEDKRSIV